MHKYVSNLGVKIMNLRKTIIFAVGLAISGLLVGLQVRPASAVDCFNVIVKYKTTNTDCAKEAQRLLQLRGWYLQSIDGIFGQGSVNATLNFQRSQYITDDGIIGPTTWARLKSPRSFDTSIPGSLPASCKTSGTVLCASKPLRKLVMLKNGVVQKVADARFGGFTNNDLGGYRIFPTVSGTYKVYAKNETAYSDRWESSMPYSIIFNPNMYVHQSGNFAKVGYVGSSHGCINIKTLAEAKWFYDNTPIGTKVVVY